MSRRQAMNFFRRRWALAGPPIVGEGPRERSVGSGIRYVRTIQSARVARPGEARTHPTVTRGQGTLAGPRHLMTPGLGYARGRAYPDRRTHDTHRQPAWPLRLPVDDLQPGRYGGRGSRPLSDHPSLRLGLAVPQGGRPGGRGVGF